MAGKVTKDTKVADLLKADKHNIDIIIAIHPKFSKLSNPLLRKAIAPRVTIKDAARIAGISVNDFLKKLEEKGFRVEYETEDDRTEYVTECNLLDTYKPVRINAIELLENDIDPFDTIRKKLKTLAPDEALEITVDFIPSPLIEIFTKQGFKACVLKKDNVYYTYFYKPYKKAGFWERIKKRLGLVKEKHDGIPPSGHSCEKDFDMVLEKYRNRLEKIDVRNLEMPQPMMKILEALEKLKPGVALFVEHKRIPQFLIPELEKKNYLWTTKKINDTHTQMIIYKPEKK